MKYKLLIGSHADIDANYVAGDIIESDIDLVKIFGQQKFEVVHEQAPPEPIQPEPEPEADSVGEDVSGDIDLPEGVSVFKRKRKYFVVADGQELNDKGLSKREVPSFVSERFE